eukprot:CAMPEP_0115765168 /NCGR_PEP_ID=MMETSP0272-20121206/102448_1 /TAXON_ID=71861 /ORGANISM="Scrippsiella trochoidea, Strain CCMP3099" /LENGTH=280 /DNA_ID=CAMNT_0003211001 /DNA_START=33 /DNA_END=875 /DNA_ORIENTATION=+
MAMSDAFASAGLVACKTCPTGPLLHEPVSSSLLAPRQSHMAAVEGSVAGLVGVMLLFTGAHGLGRNRQRRGRFCSSSARLGTPVSVRAVAADGSGSPGSNHEGNLHATYVRVSLERVSQLGDLDDDVCEVIVHSSPVMSGDLDGPTLEPFAEIVVPEGRLRSSVGEALAIALRLAVPALVCTTYLFQAAKTCVDRALLEECIKEDHENCDLALWELSYDLGEWVKTARVSKGDAHAANMLLQDVNEFAWYWSLKGSKASNDGEDWDSFGAFRETVIHNNV